MIILISHTSISKRHATNVLKKKDKNKNPQEERSVIHYQSQNIVAADFFAKVAKR